MNTVLPTNLKRSHLSMLQLQAKEINYVFATCAHFLDQLYTAWWLFQVLSLGIYYPLKILLFSVLSVLQRNSLCPRSMFNFVVLPFLSSWFLRHLFNAILTVNALNFMQFHHCWDAYTSCDSKSPFSNFSVTHAKTFVACIPPRRCHRHSPLPVETHR